MTPEGRPPLRIVSRDGLPEREVLIAQAEKGIHGDPAWRCGAPALVADLEAKRERRAMSHHRTGLWRVHRALKELIGLPRKRGLHMSNKPLGNGRKGPSTPRKGRRSWKPAHTQRHERRPDVPPRKRCKQKCSTSWAYLGGVGCGGMFSAGVWNTGKRSIETHEKDAHDRSESAERAE